MKEFLITFIPIVIVLIFAGIIYIYGRDESDQSEKEVK